LARWRMPWKGCRVRKVKGRCKANMRYFEKFEKFLITSLLVMMVVVVFLAIVDLAWLLIKDIFSPPEILLSIGELLDIFGLFLLVLIGVELLETVKAYLIERAIHVEVVMTVAIIAIARKVIILDINKLESLTLIGIAAIVMALAVGYYLIRTTRK
jgi:uncharacterized membrane protein (DUF373 family)